MGIKVCDYGKTYLGKLCGKGHDYNGSGQSLRYQSIGCCRECVLSRAKKSSILNREKPKRKNDRRSNLIKDLDLIYFDSAKFHIGVLCQSNHEFNGSGGSIRRNNDNRCVECIDINRDYDTKEVSVVEEMERQELILQAARNRRIRSLKEGSNTRRKRIRSQSNGIITSRQIADIIKSAVKCPYCLRSLRFLDKVVDHIIPLSRGGLQAIYNLVVCCKQCNSSKAYRDYSDWLDCLEPKQRKSAERLYYKRYGVSPIQGVLPLTFEPEDKSDD